MLEKFKKSDLTKFDGNGDPRAHLRSYLIAMKTTQLNEGQVAQFFALSLERFPHVSIVHKLSIGKIG